MLDAAVEISDRGGSLVVNGMVRRYLWWPTFGTDLEVYPRDFTRARPKGWDDGGWLLTRRGYKASPRGRDGGGADGVAGLPPHQYRLEKVRRGTGDAPTEL